MAPETVVLIVLVPLHEVLTEYVCSRLAVEDRY